MAGQPASEFRAALEGNLRLPASLEDIKAAYRGSKPFPHVVMDNLFHEESLNPLLSEIADMSSDQWVNVDRDPRERTVRMRSAAEMKQAGDHLVSMVHSAAFLYFLSEITGVRHLLPDPYLQGGGFAVMRRGDYFDVHADRNVAYDTGLTRRLAMIIYLNKAWQPEYHGELELWSPDGKRAEVSVEPLFNRTILFEVAYPNFHGVPAPLACPADWMRQSFIVYYHTVGIDGKQNVRPHTSIFAPHLYAAKRVTLRSIAREVTPPLLVRGVRKLVSTLAPKVR